MIKAGLVSAKSNQDLKKEKALKDQSMEIGPDTIEESKLAGHIQKVWETNRLARWDMKKRLEYCLRSRKGEYSPGELQSILGGSGGGADPIYLKLTGTKCRGASSWIRDIILPAGGKPWSLQPTVEPTIPQAIQDAAKAEAVKDIKEMIMSGTQMGPLDVLDYMTRVSDKVKDEIKKIASSSASKMETKIEDKMEEGGWTQALEDFLEDFVTYPTAFFKGPYYKETSTLTWGKGFTPIVVKQIGLHWSRVSPWDMYPSPHARDLKRGDLIEHIRLTREQLYSFKDQEGYNNDQIDDALKYFENQSTTSWMWDNFERDQLESDSTFLINRNDVNVCDALHYWGSVKGECLIDWGISSFQGKPINPVASYEVDAIKVDRCIIRAVINDDPMHLRPYHHACWDSVPGSIWGIALPEQMEDHQKMVNACARSLATNMSIASGPQVMVLTDLLADGEDVTGIYPMKVWQGKTSPLGNGGDPIKFFQPDMNVDGLLKVLETFESKADDVTNVPRYSYGNQNIAGAGSTASGLSMLMNSAAKGIRRAISNIDSNVIRPSVYQAFIYLMLDDPDPEIKGDCKVVPMGSNALLIKDQLQIRLQGFLQQTANPIDMQIIGMKGRATLLRESAKILDLPDIVPSDDEIDAMQKQQEQQQQEQQQMQMQAQQQAMAQGQQPPQGGPAQPPSAQASLPGNQMQGQQNSLNAGAS